MGEVWDPDVWSRGHVSKGDGVGALNEEFAGGRLIKL